VVVPAGAELWFDGKETDKAVTNRVFTSASLPPNQSSVLTVKAKWNGITREMQLVIRPGDSTTVDMSRQ
jgi:uncharacterized protein (TIGR03000 family)